MAQAMGEWLVTPQLPIIVVEGLDVTAYSTREEAQCALEPWWVTERCGFAYDAEGRRLRAEVIGPHVLLHADGDRPMHAEELAASIRAHLRAVGRHGVRDDSLLSELVSELTPR